MARKLVLIKPTPTMIERKPAVSSALLALGSYLGKTSPEWKMELLDLQFEQEGFQTPYVKDLVAEAGAVAISSGLTRDYLPCLYLARDIRMLNPKVPIIVGGTHVNLVPGDFTNHKVLFDFVVTGWGEIALNSILNYLVKREYRPPPRQVFMESPALRDPTPSMEFDWNLLSRYFKDKTLAPKVLVKFSRGCTQRCHFCANSGSFRHPFRGLEPRGALGQIRNLLDFIVNHAVRPYTDYLDYGGRALEVADDIFGNSLELNQKFLSRLIDQRASLPVEDFDLILEQRVDQFPRSDIELYDEARAHVQFGLESLDPGILENMGKARGSDKYLKSVERIFHHPVQRKNTFYILMVIWGCPSETRDSIDNTKSKLEAIAREISSDSPVFLGAQPFVLFPGTQTYLRMFHYWKTFGSWFYFPDWWYERNWQDISAFPLINDPSASFTFFHLFSWMRDNYPGLFHDFNERYEDDAIREFVTGVWDERQFKHWCNDMLLNGRMAINDLERVGTARTEQKAPSCAGKCLSSACYYSCFHKTAYPGEEKYQIKSGP